MVEIIEISDEDVYAAEDLGSKEKYWVIVCNNQKCLFKIPRNNTGEHWSEFISCKIAADLGLPHAEYYFARHNLTLGILTPSFVPENASLILGNTILGAIDKNYPAVANSTRYKLKEHKLFTVLAVNHFPQLPYGWQESDEIKETPQLFVGYLLLDALIGNTDRHHENWGWLAVPKLDETKKEAFDFHLTPTFDHASSLGRELTDEIRKRRLETKDENYSVKAYCMRALSAFYDEYIENKPLTTLEVYKSVLDHVRFSLIAKSWIKKLNQINLQSLSTFISGIDDDLMTDTSKEFAFEVIKTNLQILSELGK